MIQNLSTGCGKSWLNIHKLIGVPGISCTSYNTVQITVIFIDFRVCDFAFAFKTQNAPCVSRFKRVLFSDRLVSAFDASYIAHYSSHGYAPLHRTLSLKLI